MKHTFFQGIKFLLVGGFATLVDLGVFDLAFWVIAGNPLISKTLSFLVSTAIKYGGNKYWTFQKHEVPRVSEVVQFVVITLVALGIDLSTFHYATKTLGPQFGVSLHLWTQISVILSALSSAVVSFLGYKLWVFKKPRGESGVD